MTLVEDWRQWKKWWSMRWIVVSAFCSAAAASYALLPADWLPSIPAWVKTALAVGAMLSAGAAAVSRVIKQPTPETKP